MRKRVTKFISVLFITSSLLVALFPFFIVKAESTYTEYTSGTSINFGTFTSGSNSNNYYKANIDGKFVSFYYNSGIYYGLVINSSSSFNYYYGSSSNGSYNRTSSLKYYSSTSYNVGLTGQYSTSNFNDKLNTTNSYSGSLTDPSLIAIYFTYGEGAIDPAPPAPTYGDLILNGYSTDIAGQGEASLGNIDHIKWDNSSDTLGNDVSDLKVRLQIVPGTYYGDSKAQLLSQTYEDMIIDINNAHEQLYDVSLGEVSFNWSDIVDWLNITSYKLWSAQLFGVNWEKEGWIYRIRLEDPENEYVGNWQTVYSSTSSGVENDFNIINNNVIDQTYITSLQEVNNLNNVNNNWIVNNTEISVTNEYTEPQQGDKPWWAYLLESILNTFNITNNFIYEGDSNTQNITNTVNDSDYDMNRKIGEYQQFEDTFIDDMDSNLTDIDTDIDFLSDNKFIASANWVAQQYNRMTNNNVIGSFIGFSLLFGLALIFIGKIH